MKRTFKRSELEELGLPEAYEGGEVIEDVIIGADRWSLNYRLVFKLSDQVGKDEAWRTTYSVGATECQDEGPWDYQETVEAELVTRVQKVIEVWEPTQTGG